jgi:hypothetical protein
MGYYDDDADGGYCIVYPDDVEGYVLVRSSSIVEAPGGGYDSLGQKPLAASTWRSASWRSTSNAHG